MTTPNRLPDTVWVEQNPYAGAAHLASPHRVNANEVSYTRTDSIEAKPQVDLSADDLNALAEFKRRYPTWWYKLGWCDISRDFDAAPQANSPEIKYITNRVWQDEFFSCDSHGTFAEAINAVMADIAAEIDRAEKETQK